MACVRMSIGIPACSIDVLDSSVRLRLPGPRSVRDTGLFCHLSFYAAGSGQGEKTWFILMCSKKVGRFVSFSSDSFSV